MKPIRHYLALAAILIASVLNLSQAYAETIEKRAAEAIIPKLEIHDAPPADALKEITKATGIKISYTPAKNEQVRVTLTLHQVPASEALKYVTELSGLKFSYEKDGILVVPNPNAVPNVGSPPPPPPIEPAPAGVLMTRVYRVNAVTFARNLKKLAAPKQGESEDQLAVRFFKDKGIDTQAMHLDQPDNTLTVHATQGNLDKVTPLVEQIGTGHP